MRNKIRSEHSPQHYQLLGAGILIAYPDFQKSKPYMFIEGWDSGRAIPTIIDIVEMEVTVPGNSVHEISIKDLNSHFRINDPEITIRFEFGGSYVLESDWNYPFYGDRIGALVSRIARPNQVSNLKAPRLWYEVNP